MHARRPLLFLALLASIIGLVVVRTTPSPSLIAARSDQPVAIPMMASIPLDSAPSELSLPLVQEQAPVPTPVAEQPEESRQRWAKRLGATRIIGPHSFPTAPNGITRQVTWFESSDDQPLVRLEQRLGWSDAPDAPGLKLVDEQAMVASHLLVGLASDATPEAAIRELQSAGFNATPVAHAPELLRVDIPSPTDAEAFDQTLEALRRSPFHLTFAEPDVLVLVDNIPNDPRYRAQWHLTSTGEAAPAALNAEAGWLTRTDAGDVIVAITDTGTRVTHEDLVDNLWINTGEIPGNGIDDDLNGVVDDVHGFNAITGDGDVSDDNGHGTHVAGIAGARGDNGAGVVGVAWNVRLLTAKFLNNRGVGTSSDAVAAIHYARRHGARVINASWSMSAASLAVEDAIRQADAAGIVFVAAAGNQTADLDATRRYPAAYDLPNLVAVASTDRGRSLTPFSNYGRDRVHLAAPGEDILSCSHQSDNGYRLLSGTSMAAPQVSGALALLQSMHPDENGQQLIQRLLAGTRLSPSLTGLVQTGGILHLPTLLATSTAVPRHDLRAQAYQFTGYQGVWNGSTAHAGRSPDDPAGLTGDRTLWFSWTAPDSGYAHWQVNAEAPATFSVVYRVQGGVITPLHGAAGTTQSLRVWADADASYLLGVGTTSAAGHAVTVNLSLPPANDLISAAEEIVGATFTVTGNNRGATRESNEPRHARVGAGRSVWWSWTAPVSTRQVITTLDTPFDTVLAVYRQDGNGNLITVAANDDSGANLLTSRVAFDAEEGVRYLIAVDSWGHDSGSGVIRLSGYGSGNIVIISDPRSQAVRLGSSINLQVRYLSTLDATVQWFKNGVPIGGGRDGRLVIGNIGSSDLGDYHAIVSNSDESATSAPATLTEFVSAPFIMWSPGNLNEVAGSPVTLRVIVQGSRPWTIQWFKNGELIEGADDESLYIAELGADDAGQYEIVIINASGTTRSSKFQVNVADSPLTAWNWITAPVQGWPIQDIRYFDNTYHAVASAGKSTKILRSDDGVTWRTQTLPPAFAGHQIEQGNGVVIVAGQNHTAFDNGTIYRSTDGGDSWALASLPLRGNVTSLKFGGGYFVALTTYDGTLRRSVDGTTWQAPVTPPANGMTHLTRQGGFFFTYNQNNTVLFRSTDGATWSSHPAGGSIQGILHDGNIYHLWTRTTYQQSEDGVTWTTAIPSTAPASPLLIHDGTRIVNAGSSQLSLGFSNTGTSWTGQGILNTGTSTAIKSLLRAGGLTLVGCQNGLLLSSPDSTKLANTFTAPLTWTSGDFNVIEFYEGEFILTNNSNHVALSSDGETWTAYGIPAINSRLDTRKVWKAGGYYWGTSRFTTGTDMLWRGRSPLDIQPLLGVIPDQLSSIAFKDGRFIAVSGQQLLTSTDEGLTWSAITPDFAVPSGSRLYVAAGRWFLLGYNTIASSSDGFTWDLGPRTNNWFVGFAENNGKFYAATTTNQLLQSTNGINWTSHTLPFTPASIYAHQGSLLFMSSPDLTGEQFFSTTDLVTWLTINTGVSATRFATGNGVMVGVSPTPHIVQNGRTTSRAPLCRLLTPIANTEFTINNLVEIAVEATAPDGNFARVELYVDDTLVATSTTPGVFRHAFSATENRSYSFHARAYNTDGLVTTSSCRATAKSPVTAPPVVTSAAFAKDYVFSDQEAYYAVSGNSLYRSVDGINWEFHSITTTLSSINDLSLDESFTRLHHANGLGMVVSRDGLDWIQVSMTSPVQYRSGVFFRFAGSLNTGTGGLYFSSNGSAWQSTPWLPQTYFTTVLMGDGPRYLGWSTSLHPHVRRSSDGVNWVNIPDLPVPVQGVEALGRFILRYPDNKIRSSEDGGGTWTTASIDTTIDKLVAVGDVVFACYASSIRKVSADGITWHDHGVPDLSTAVAYGNGNYVSAGYNTIRVSTDGLHWTTYPPPWLDSPSTPFIVHGPAGFIAFHPNGQSWISTDGINWTSTGIPQSEGTQWQSYVAIGDIQVAIRDVNVALNPIKRSLDGGKTWSFSPPPYAHPVFTRSLYSTGTSFVLRDGNGKLYRSNDGAAWTAVPVVVDGVNVSITHLIPTGDLWFAVANDNYVYRSLDDGLTWLRHQATDEPGVQLVNLYFSGQHFLAAAYVPNGSPPKMFQSDDGIEWTSVTPPTNSSSNIRVSAGHGRFIWVSGIKTYLSDNAIDWVAGPDSPESNGIAYVATNGFYMKSGGDLYYSDNGTGWELSRGGISGGLVELNGVLHTIGASAAIPVHFADAAVHHVQTSVGIHGIGDTLSAQLAIANVGATSLPDLDVELYLSRDTFHGNSDDLSVGTLTIPAADLPPQGESRVIQLALVLPPTIEGGAFYVGARLDPNNKVGEFNKSNNRRFTTTTTIEVPEWTLDLQTSGDGGVAQSVSAVRYVHGSTVTLAPTAGKNATFAGWSGSESSDRSDLTVTMRENKTLTATFAATRQLSVVVRGAGTVQLDTPDGRYAQGASATLLALPAPGWRFLGWEEDLSGDTAQRTLSMHADRVVVAKFEYPKESWKVSHFTSEELAIPSISDDDAAPGPLGVSNLISYLSGRDPRSSAPFNVAPELRSDRLYYRYTRNTGAIGATLTAEASTDLLNWNVPLTEQIIDEQSGIETVEVIVPVAAKSRLFIRLRAVPTSEAP